MKWGTDCTLVAIAGFVFLGFIGSICAVVEYGHTQEMKVMEATVSAGANPIDVACGIEMRGVLSEEQHQICFERIRK